MTTRSINILAVILLCTFLSVISNPLFASATKEAAHEEKFNPGDLIFHHIYDSYEWHIMTIGETHVSIPMLAIIISDTKGFNMFLTSKFHHGEEAYKGFKIAGHGEKFEGKIVEQNEAGEWVKPMLDLSITKNVVALFASVLLLCLIFISIANKYKQNQGKAPKGLQNAVEPLILFIRDDVAKAAIGKDKYMKFLPYLLTVFFFIFLNNLMGLIPIFPGGANVTGNITITLVLALFTFVLTTVNGNKNYWTHMVNTPGVPWWLKIPVPLMPVVELMGLFTKPFVLMVRLFANISAGHIIALGFYSLIFVFGNMHIGAGYGISIISVVFTIFMSLLELLVAFIQAYVFTLLSALYFGMAVEEHH